jgi:hypothetical protein
VFAGAVLLFGVTFVCGLGFAAGCSENLHFGTDRERVCNGVQGVSWLLLLIAPMLALVLSQAIALFRRHPALTALAILTLTLAGWTFLLLIVSSNIGDTRGEAFHALTALS